ncbi:MAG TPA: acyl-CoA thioester hydrolase/BAAT C-terminal domain-containing protein [Cytophagales bacterium]|nr:acyl-CoA thioester hydrolase/BAAT C-terminal domain-containing protein [Cytophagales bacterium]
MRKKILILVALLFIAIVAFSIFYTPSLPVNYGKVDARLFLAASQNQPLVVAFGGSEGGNVYASEELKEIRNKFLQKGYGFLAIGYFGGPNASEVFDRISLNAIHAAIIKASQNPKINKEKIALIGGSRGGELVLNFGKQVSVGETSAWSYDNQPLPYLPSTLKSVYYSIKDDWVNAFKEMLTDSKAVEKAAIKVENINGSILLISAKNDEVWPSFYMSNMIMERLREKKFQNYYEHIVIEGGHTEADKDYSLTLEFLKRYFK